MTQAAALLTAMQKGYPPEHAAVISALDRALEGHDASVAIPVMVMVLENITSQFAPLAQERVAELLSESAFRIAAGARAMKEAAAPEQAAQPTTENDDGKEQPQSHETPGPQAIQ